MTSIKYIVITLYLAVFGLQIQPDTYYTMYPLCIRTRSGYRADTEPDTVNQVYLKYIKYTLSILSMYVKVRLRSATHGGHPGNVRSSGGCAWR